MPRKRNITPEMFIAAVIKLRKDCKSQESWDHAVKMTRETCAIQFPQCLHGLNLAIAEAEEMY